MQNKTQKEIAEELGCSSSTVEKWIRKHGLGDLRRGLKANEPYNNKEVIYELYHLRNLTQKEIASRLGCTESMIERRVKSLGLAKRVYNKEKPYENKDVLFELLVENNMTYEQTAKELDCSMTAVRNWAIKFGIERNTKPLWIELDKKYGSEIVREYLKEDTYLEDLGEKYDVHTYHIKNVLEHRKIPLKTRSEIKGIGDKEGVYRTYPLNQDYFKTWTHNMAYILGFVAADGCINTGSKDIDSNWGTLIFNQQREDREILEKFKAELMYEGDVRDSYSKLNGEKFPTSSLSVSSRIMIDDIKEIGIRERKTFDLEFPSIPQAYEIDFIRGFFDGDGTVGGQYPTNSNGVRSKTLQIRVRIASASKEFINALQSTLVRYGLKEKRVVESTSIHEVTYSTRESLLIHKLFYRDSNSLFLQRKKDRFDELIRTREGQIQETEDKWRIKVT